MQKQGFCSLFSLAFSNHIQALIVQIYCSGSKAHLREEKAPGVQGLKAKPILLLLLAVYKSVWEV